MQVFINRLRALIRAHRDAGRTEREQELRRLGQQAMRRYYGVITEELHEQKALNRQLPPEKRKHWLVAVIFLGNRQDVCARLFFRTESEARAYMKKLDPLTVDLYAV